MMHNRDNASFHATDSPAADQPFFRASSRPLVDNLPGMKNDVSIIAITLLACLNLAPFVRGQTHPSVGVRSVVAPIAPSYDTGRKLADVDTASIEWSDATRNRSVPAKIYFPIPGDAGRSPLIIFSHGLGGSREGYEYLGRQWAANGYVVVHLDHIGSDTDALRGPRPLQSLRRAANLQNAIDRAKDVRFAIDQMASIGEKVPALRDRIAMDHIGVGGHSFGANTAMLVAGQTVGFGNAESFADPRVKAVIAMSEPTPFDHARLDDDYAAVKIPVFMMTGTEDDSPVGDTKAADRRLPFDHLKSDASLLILTGGDHMVFSGRLREPKPTDALQQKLIRFSSTAFWDAYMKSNTAARTWLENGDGFRALLGA